MRWPIRIWRLIFPPRASTQTWMFLTFALFVGIAVAGVGLYVFLILGSQIQDAARNTHVTQARQIANILENADSDEERERLVRVISDLTELHLVVAREGRVLWRGMPSGFKSAGQFMESSSVRSLRPGEAYFSSEKTPDNGRIYFVAVAQSASGFTLGVEQPERPLHSVARNMQLTLLLGMVMAFLLAVVGSWVAADRVTRPLLAIGQSADNITAGDFSTDIRVTTRSAEIQDLANNLDRMSVNYREKIEELERLTRLQSEFIGNVGHEVRNPIFAIGGYIEALESNTLSESTRQQFTAKGLKNLYRLSSLFNNLIEIARLEYREDLIKPRVFNFAELAHEVGEMLRPKAAEKNLALNIQSSMILVRADRELIRQVIVNLIDNAITYSEEGAIRCQFQRRLDKVRVEVLDNGRGIGENHLGRIFERFYRVNPDRSRKSGGAGLGLSIVKQILQAHGESIHVESATGRGARFWFELPYAEAADEPEEIQ